MAIWRGKTWSWGTFEVENCSIYLNDVLVVQGEEKKKSTGKKSFQAKTCICFCASRNPGLTQNFTFGASCFLFRQYIIDI